MFECDVTEFYVMPKKENDQVAFSLNKDAMVINLMDTNKDKILAQTEIDKKDAIELARLILLKYS